MKKMTNFKGFYEYLKDELNVYKGEVDDVIYYGPELFKLLTDLMNDKTVAKKYRLMMNAAIAYFVVPFDVIPEEIYGPYGYIDDVFLCSYVLLEIKKKYGKSLLDKYWDGDEPITDVLKNAQKVTKKELRSKTKEILEYSGLD